MSLHVYIFLFVTVHMSVTLVLLRMSSFLIRSRKETHCPLDDFKPSEEAHRERPR